MVEGLAARLASSSTTDRVSERKKPKSRKASMEERMSYKETLYEVCPYFKVGYVSANAAIREAVKGEFKIHIVDFHIFAASQWVRLMRALAEKEGGPPAVRITGIDDSVPAYARGSMLEETGRRLRMAAREFSVPFEFHAVAISGEEVEEGHLAVIPGEALVVNFNLGLHRIPGQAVSSAMNHRGRILSLVKSLSPKVVTLVEQDLDTNTGPFLRRFTEMLDYYAAVFDSIDLAPQRDDRRMPLDCYRAAFESIDLTPPRDDSRRIGMEQHCLGTEIVNILACADADRVETYEPFVKWKARLMMAGFTPSPLSSHVSATIRKKLQEDSPDYLCDNRDGVHYLGWKDRPLVVISAWH